MHASPSVEPLVPSVETLDPADAAAWARFVAIQRARTYEGIVHDGFLEGLLAHLDGEAAEIREELASGVGRYAVAWLDGAIVGAASSTAVPMAWEEGLGFGPVPAERALDALYVAPSAHGSGLADRLLTLVLDDAPTMLWLISGNERARRFYERRGFAMWGDEHSTGPTWNHVPMRRMLRAEAPAARG
ncbi:GNAT family N-acetyltransferase [Agrococcus jejuensis]|uniref:Acetyltransferase (GNAT) family protein n=1 Tax=Agrococcus jejuensis TaxID=399736 RepID=A0A1G8GB25_9MICO|nr:GNAT family N-acetyltransferase [Agrococcus jejuensis]SDH91563.1 Acetyltransferase (GNAT) family protein [Agrococcus jejuensis]